jgi:hypothetical protein
MLTATCNTQRIFWKRLGLAGFAFFLVKGLAWLFVPVLLYVLGIAG